MLAYSMHFFSVLLKQEFVQIQPQMYRNSDLVKQSKNLSISFNRSTTLYQIVIHMHTNTY